MQRDGRVNTAAFDVTVSVIFEPVVLGFDIHRDVVAPRDCGFFVPFLVGGGLNFFG